MEKIFNKTKLEERTWDKLVTLDTLFWYCNGPEPTTATRRYDLQIHQHTPITQYIFTIIIIFSFKLFDLRPSCAKMNAAKKRAHIKQQDALKKQQEGQPPKGTGSVNPSTKRKQPEKYDHLPKKPKTILEPVVGLKAETKKTVTPLSQGKGKGLMKGPSVTEKPPVLLREDSKYALEQLSSIITSDDYEDLSNHATEAMGETRLFNIA